MRNSKKTLLAVFVLMVNQFVFGLPSLTSETDKIVLPSVIEENATAINYHKEIGSITKAITFSEKGLKFSKTQLGFPTEKYKNKVWDCIELEGASSLGEPFKPALPAHGIKVAIPWATEIISFIAIPKDSYIVTGKYEIIPSECPRLALIPPPGKEYPALPNTKPDSITYNSLLPFPGKVIDLGGQGDFQGQGLAWFTIYPIQYIPAEGKLILYTRIELNISYGPARVEPKEKPPKFFTRQMIKLQEELKSSVINPEDVYVPSHEDEGLLPPNNIPYAIITTEELKPYFQPLRTWRRKSGMYDTLVTTAWINSNYSGADIQAKIRSFISDFKSRKNTIYFLLGGDAPVVPYRIKPYTWQGLSENVVTDFYYADFDDDWICEVAVGRASVQNQSEVTSFCNKILTYEKNPPTTAYPLKAFFFAFDLDANNPATTPGQLLKDTIDKYAVPPRFDPITKVYDSHSGNHLTNSINALNAGHNLANHFDHANSSLMGTGYMKHGYLLSNSDMDALTNGNKKTILYSLGCSTAAFTQEDCIAEHFVHNSNGGGLAWIGYSVDSWYHVGQAHAYYSQKLDTAFFKSLFLRNNYYLGWTLASSKNAALPASPEDLTPSRWDHEALTLLGDPGIPIWTDAIGQLTVTHPLVIHPNETFILQATKPDLSPLQGALVCLWKNDEIYWTYLTDNNGNIYYQIPENIGNGDMSVTVTAQNYRPYEGTCNIQGGAPPPDTIPPWVDVTAPNGGEKWPIGTEQKITWKAGDDQGITAQIIYYSINGGETWEFIDALDGEPRDYLWKVPKPPSEKCLVKLEVYDMVHQSDDQSDKYFVIYGEDTPKEIAGSNTPVLSSFSLALSNPSSAGIQIQYQTHRAGNVCVEIYDVNGKLIRQIINEFQEPGMYIERWDRKTSLNRAVKSGIYFVKIQSGSFLITKKVILLE